ncbi:acyl--CoA ligase [Tateyamaria omphalii]|nr:class I adenylate-forming enzyme family protein [Tateyamaria omphalii]MBY5932449.1 acyl--CoA ligase [Tateyamaria omphalii]
MAAHVLAHADRLPDKVAVSVVDTANATTLTYRALKHAVLGTGGGLRAAGCVPGDIVLLRLGNTLDFPIAYLGALAVGLVPVPTSAALTEPEVARIIADLRPRLTLRDPNVSSAPGAPEIGLATLNALRAHPPADWHMGDPERLGYIIYTSGTSGQPRAVAHAHRAIWARQMMHDGWYGLRSDDVLMHAGAFNWTYTLGTGLMDPWSVGATALIPAPGTGPDALGSLLSRHGATIFAAAPGVYRQMLARADMPDVPSLRHGLSAGEKLPETTLAAWRKATGTDIFEAYGMSECSTFISSSPAHPAKQGALGQPQTGRYIAILADGAPTERGAPGTIAVHRSDPGLMREYLNAPEETAAKYAGDWFMTGDMGVMDEDGQITYLGRDDDMMNAGGYRVSPIEVEAALADAPGLTGVGVTQIEVKTGVFIIAAFYTSSAPLDETALRAYVEPKLARYKHPRAYIHVPKLPTGANGKLVRRRLPLFWPQTTKAT